jgi:hypothetical protein
MAERKEPRKKTESQKGENMKREDVSKIFTEATPEQIDKILDLNSADIGKAKKGFDDLKADLETAKQTITDINKQYDDLKAANASAEDYKTKYDELVADNKRKADEQAARELEAAERAEFDGYFTEQKKEWYNQMTADGYFAKYRAAKIDPVNKGKMMADILHNLTKDDPTAFKGVQPEVKLGGAKPIGGGENRMAELYKNNPFFKG